MIFLTAAAICTLAHLLDIFDTYLCTTITKKYCSRKRLTVTGTHHILIGWEETPHVVAHPDRHPMCLITWGRRVALYIVLLTLDRVLMTRLLEHAAAAAAAANDPYHRTMLIANVEQGTS